jgi:hypothetical protein
VNRETSKNGHNLDDEDTALSDDAQGEYDAMLVLERLETLEEEMDELGVRTLDEVRRRIVELHEHLDRGE